MKTIQCADIPPHTTDKFFLVGPPGGGKSGLAGTLPGKTLAICFDPSARTTYARFQATNHITIAEYIKETQDLTPYTMKDMKARPALNPGQVKETAATFTEFGKDLNEARKSGFLPGEFNNLIIDSCTTLQDLIMQAVLVKNGRSSEIPGIDDWQSQKSNFLKVIDACVALPMNVVFIFHDELVKDETTGRIIFNPILTGNLKARVPNRMGHLLRCTAKRDKDKKTRYYIQTTPDRYVEGIRTAFDNLDPDHDVTIEDFSKPFDYGLGKIIKEQKR